VTWDEVQGDHSFEIALVEFMKRNDLLQKDKQYILYKAESGMQDDCRAVFEVLGELKKDTEFPDKYYYALHGHQFTDLSDEFVQSFGAKEIDGTSTLKSVNKNHWFFTREKIEPKPPPSSYELLDI